MRFKRVLGFATSLPIIAHATRQLSASPTSYQGVQAVEPIISTKAKAQRNENAVNAPAAMNETIAAGAADLVAVSIFV